MWLVAMNPLAVHTEHSWLLGRKKNRRQAIMSCHCNNLLVGLLNLTEQTRWIHSRWQPHHSHREFCASKMHFPLQLFQDGIKKKGNCKLLRLLSLWTQLLTETHLTTWCWSTLSNIIFHRGLGWEMLQNPQNLWMYSKVFWLGLLSTLKRKKPECEMTKPARKIRFSVYLAYINLLNFNSEAVTCLRPRWEMKVDEWFQGKAAGINLFF